jgi:hypothetical protein
MNPNQAETPATPSVEMTEAQYIALAESDREAALKLMWPDESDAEAMRFLDEIIFDGYIASLKAKLQPGPIQPEPEPIEPANPL